MFAFLFPGQGSQTPGMGKFLYDEFKIARETFEEASDAINFDIKKLCFNESFEVLSLTENTQPALLTISTATTRVLDIEFGARAEITAGHSIGEYSSLVLGHVIEFKEAVRAVRLRGQAMQSAVPVGLGGMSATIGLTEDQVVYLCHWAMKETGLKSLSPANFNSAGQIVISGNLKILEWLQTNFKVEMLPGETKRAKLIPLQVSAPFHCEMMKPAEETMDLFFKDVTFKNSRLPIIQNVHAQSETQGAILKKNIVSQISAPVRWSQSMELLKNNEKNHVIEVGNGSVLKGLLKKIDGDFFTVYSTNSLAELKLIETESSK